MTETPAKRHVLTVALEDYFQVGAFNRVIQRGRWYRFETRLEKNVDRALALFDRHDVKATFFVLGWIADRFPELVRKVADRGHEIASKGYYHRGISGMTPGESSDVLRGHLRGISSCRRCRSMLHQPWGVMSRASTPSCQASPASGQRLRRSLQR